jgi:ABC-type dipeptide/oligopeptide/nickel transport system permease subunit
MRSHVLPQLGTLLIAYSLLLLPVMMIQEAFLSFLGLGVPPPTASWGTLIAEGVALAETAPWILVAATGSFALWLTGLHLAGNRLVSRFKVQRVTGPPDRVMSIGPVFPPSHRTSRETMS